MKSTVALCVGMACLVLASPGRPRAQSPQADSKKWDVATAFGPTQTIAFDTSEGTWMNVDVSPDGRQVVFDLLGDIYTMPAGGSGTDLQSMLV